MSNAGCWVHPIKKYIFAFGLFFAIDALAADDVEVVSEIHEPIDVFLERVARTHSPNSCGTVSRTGERYVIGFDRCAPTELISEKYVLLESGAWQRVLFLSDDITINLNQQLVKALRVADVSANKEISKDQFGAKIARPLAEYTKRTQFEACAQICKSDDGSWGASITTIQSHVMCPITSACPGNTKPTGEGIHSHPTGASYAINEADKLVLLSGPFYRLGAKEKRGRTDVFSQEDFRSGPGYMVTDQERLFHQDGARKVRSISIDM